MPQIIFNNITSAYKGTQLLDKIYHGNKQVFPAVPDPSNGDPLWNNVLLYLDGDSPAQDLSLNQTAFTGTPSYNTTIKKYGTSSLVFPAIANLLIFNTNIGLTQGITIDYWFRFPSFGNPPFGMLNGTTLSGINNTNIHVQSSDIVIFGTAIAHEGIFAIDTWHHIAVTFLPNNVKRLFVDGVQRFEVTNTNALNFTGYKLMLGGYKISTSTYRALGFIDSFRITDAIRYNANFNPETDTYLAY